MRKANKKANKRQLGYRSPPRLILVVDIRKRLPRRAGPTHVEIAKALDVESLCKAISCFIGFPVKLALGPKDAHHLALSSLLSFAVGAPFRLSEIPILGIKSLTKHINDITPHTSSLGDVPVTVELGGQALPALSR